MSQVIEMDGSVVEALRARRQVILDNIRDNDEAGLNYQKVLSQNVAGPTRLLPLMAINIITIFNFLYFGIFRKLKLMRRTDANSKK